MSNQSAAWTSILMTGLGAEPKALVDDEMVACERVLRSGSYVLGQEVENFERLWAGKCGCRYAVGTGNGLDAIEIGLRAVGVGPGDEVITSAMTAFATVLAILRSGATPVLSDINEGDALLDAESVGRCVTPRTKAILLVHLYGRLADMEKWKCFCDERNLLLLEDCAQAHLAQWKEEFAGTFGEWGAFSFYPTKNLGTLGDGGIVITNSRQIAEKARRLRNYGQSTRYHHTELGLNSRLDELQAAILNVRVEWLERFTKRRREVAALYRSRIHNPLIALLSRPRRESSHVYHLFVIKCAKRLGLITHLEERGIASLIHYPLPIHRQEATRFLPADPSGLRRAESHAATCLSIPCHPQMDEDAVDRVIDALNSFA